MSQLTLPPDSYTESLLQAKETLLQLLKESSPGSTTPQGKLNQIAAETLTELVEHEKTAREELLLNSPEGRSTKAVAFLVGTVFLGLYLAGIASR